MCSEKRALYDCMKISQLCCMAAFACLQISVSEAPFAQVMVSGGTAAESFEPFTRQVPQSSVSFSMVPITGGRFLIGATPGTPNSKEDEGPQREVEVGSFWMGTHEVTYELFEIFREKKLDLNEDGSPVDGITRPSPPYEDPTFGMGKYGFPATSMTQYAALAFCKWLSEKTGEFYRLPTEAEWEYACKGGSKDAFFFGNDASQLGEYAWYYENSSDAFKKVGQKKPNPFGLYDMLGNVAEWTLDQYDPGFYATLSAEVPTVAPWRKPTTLHPRTVRGGSYTDDAEALRPTARQMSDLRWKSRDPQIPKSFWWNTDSPFVGFRLVKPYPQPSKEEQRQFWAFVLDE